MELTPKTVFETAKNVGTFVLDRLRGGAWAELPREIKSANIVYFPNLQREHPDGLPNLEGMHDPDSAA